MHSDLPTYLPAKLSASANLLSWQPDYLSANLSSCQPANLPTYPPVYLPISLHDYLSNNLSLCLHAYLPTSLAAYLPTYLPASMHNYIPASAYLQLVGACSGTFPGGKAAGWVAGLLGNIAITAHLELELGMSLTIMNISLYCHYNNATILVISSTFWPVLQY